MRSKIDKILEIIAVLAVIGVIIEGIYLYAHWPRQEPLDSDNIVIEEPVEEPIKEPIEDPPVDIVLPDSFDLDIPFLCQAPLGDWRSPFDHACEEATILMVHYYLSGEQFSPETGSQDIRNMVGFQEENYGFAEDTATKETAQLIRDYYGYQAKAYYDISLEDIKKELVKGNPVIVPTAGRLLGNPNYASPGPLLHMLVIKGYTPTHFITNDSGTRMGADYVYFYEVLENSIHDWAEGDVYTGRSAMISVSLDR
ncbi:C39 family peptidase [Candidatus Parcubacteria bacterium]|nr:C39 family peptidase [Candidatus Parcubacteria bacterium]